MPVFVTERPLYDFLLSGLIDTICAVIVPHIIQLLLYTYFHHVPAQITYDNIYNCVGSIRKLMGSLEIENRLQSYGYFVF